MRILSTLDSFLKNPKQRLRQIPGLFCEPLFLHQMGKVASVTIANTLNPHYRIYHTHTGSDFTSAYDRVFHKISPKYPIPLITIIREPVGRKKSVFFQNIINSPYSFSYSSKEEVIESGVEHLLERYHSWKDGFTETSQWFDRHFVRETGVDIYKHHFDPKKGWGIIEEGNWKILILRYNDLNRNFIEGINAFTNDPKKRVSKLVSGNISENKWYGQILKQFSHSLNHDPDEIRAIYRTDFMKYFYTASEINKYLEVNINR
jgi:hypothetical protein